MYWPSKYQSKDNHRTVLSLATIFFFNKINITQVYWPSWPSPIFFFFKSITHVYWPSKYQSKDNQRTVLLLATIFFFYKIIITQVYWPSWPSTIFFFLIYYTRVLTIEISKQRQSPNSASSCDDHRTVFATIFFFNKINITQVYWPSWPSTIFFFLNVLHKCIDHQNINAKTINEQCFFLRQFFFLIK